MTFLSYELMRDFCSTILLFFIALNTSFMISCGFDCDRIPKCHLAFLTGFFISCSEEAAVLAVDVGFAAFGLCSIVSKVAEISFNSIYVIRNKN